MIFHTTQLFKSNTKSTLIICTSNNIDVDSMLQNVFIKICFRNYIYKIDKILYGGQATKRFQCYQNTALCCKLKIKNDASNYIARSVFSYKRTALY